MALVGSARDELREGLLLERGRVLIVEPFGRNESGRQRLWDDQVTHAKRRKHGARECSHVDDASFGVQTLLRFERLAFVAKFAVVVILNDH
jgi:hypothetical protein